MTLLGTFRQLSDEVKQNTMGTLVWFLVFLQFFYVFLLAQVSPLSCKILNTPS